MNSEIIEKLRKMLSLANSANQNEAEIAMEKAIALATKHEIDLAVVNLNKQETKKEEMVKTDKVMGQRFPVTQEYVSRILMGFFNIKLIYSGSRSVGRSVIFLGRKSDVQFALYVQDFLNEHMMRSWQYYQKVKNVDTAYRATFFYAFEIALSKKLRAAKNNQVNDSISAVETERQENVRTSYALVVQSNEKELEAFKDAQFPKLRKASRARKSYFRDSDAAIVGQRYGEATNINRPIG
jgi:hypothetical protein